MGLAERRATKEFVDNHLPGLLTKLQTAAGFAVPVAVEYEQLAIADAVTVYPDVWTKVYFRPVIEALEQIARDPLGKEALKAGLNSITFKNSSDNYSAGSAITFESGVLTVDHSPYSNVDDYDSRRDYIVKLVESKL